ncbi:unnamed protein product [Chondrus crispus]|uniref:Uncharacterized protein n=1 Tax=Chondrus crispus TaxID=2769 RepID=R7Q488_CHOCR|nr:unnamed protein product [Chondrus crispus]CDF32161.1 unnamed protein product [Chondrus crispus]|eukprot:XP_005711826.1 unnamed protein product [Chondrus crispus]
MTPLFWHQRGTYSRRMRCSCMGSWERREGRARFILSRTMRGGKARGIKRMSERKRRIQALAGSRRQKQIQNGRPRRSLSEGEYRSRVVQSSSLADSLTILGWCPGAGQYNIFYASTGLLQYVVRDLSLNI